MALRRGGHPSVVRGLRITVRPGHPDFLDLPWSAPLDEWSAPRLVEVVRGVHRHVVRFVDYDGRLYALKELPDRVAQREYRLLRRMADEGLPVVEAVGLVTRSAGRSGSPLEGVLITRYLDWSLPYRTLFRHRRSGDDVTRLPERLLDALVALLVRLHSAGFYWGDCSLSNTLFRRDAGALAAYLVDAETSEWHPSLTSGQRRTDVEVTLDNVVGGLMDVQAELGLPPEPDPIEVAEDLRVRYSRLWAELTAGQLLDSGAPHAVESRLRRLNELGFDVEEVEYLPGPDGDDRIVLRPAVVEAGHHRRRLRRLTGLEAQENQARSLLNDLANFRASEERKGRPGSEAVMAHRWLAGIFEPTVTAIPESLRGKLEPAEVFHEVIEHKWFLSEAAGADVGLDEALASYLRSVLPSAPEERLLLTVSDDLPGGEASP